MSNEEFGGMQNDDQNKDDTEETTNLISEEDKKEEEKEFSITSEIYEWVEAVAYSLVTVVFIFTFLLRMVWVEGISMENTLHNDDRVIISGFLYEPRPNDIVVFTDDFLNRPLIKRIIATEGQIVTFDEKTKKIIVDGVPVNEPYIKDEMQIKGELLQKGASVTVPQDHVFVMGDNRNNSLDSRFSNIGTVDKHQILGRVIIRVYPFNKIGTVKNG